jgi:lipid kinase YegS
MTGEKAPQMRQLRIIVHGKAADNARLREAVKRQRERGHCIEVRVTWEKGDAARFAEQSAEEGIETVVAAGGDGTISEVASGLAAWGLEREGLPSLGILPLGTGNDFAVAAGIPLDLVAALELVVVREPVAADLGRVGDQVFINMATGGFGAQVTRETPEELKKSLGGAAYLITGLTRFSGIKDASGRFRGPGFKWSGPFLVFAIGNGRQAGGGHVLCPEARIDDGMLDLRILPSLPPEDLPGTLARMLRDGLDAVERDLISAKLPWIELEAESGLSINLDGEPLSGANLRFEVIPGALQIHLPEDSPLLDG